MGRDAPGPWGSGARCAGWSAAAPGSSLEDRFWCTQGPPPASRSRHQQPALQRAEVTYNKCTIAPICRYQLVPARPAVRGCSLLIQGNPASLGSRGITRFGQVATTYAQQVARPSPQRMHGDSGRSDSSKPMPALSAGAAVLQLTSQQHDDAAVLHAGPTGQGAKQTTSAAT